MLFEASKLKVDRAVKHTQELQSKIGEYIAPRPVVIVQEKRGDWWVQCIRVKEPIPKCWPTIIGDAIHNLRASLDLMACELVRMNDEDDKGALFPFAHSQDDLKNVMMNKRHMNRASSSVQAHILKLAPYKGELRALHDLDLTDKHRSLIPALTQVAESNIAFGLSDTNGNPIPISIPIKDGEPMTATSKPAIGPAESPIDISVVFPFGGPLGGVEVTAGLESLTKLVLGIFDSFEALGTAKLGRVPVT